MLFNRKSCLLMKIFLFLSILFACNTMAMSQSRICIDASLCGAPLHVDVDSPLAANMITHRDDSGVKKIFFEYPTLDAETLKNITARYSMDVASIFFTEKLYEKPENKQIQNYYFQYIDTVSDNHLKRNLVSLKKIYVVFIPGFNYEYNRSNFQQQRQFLDSCGIPYEMIKTKGLGMLEDNAQVIANRLQEVNKLHRNIILISVSKGSFETALALSQLMKLDDMSSIKAWINTCGILQGTPLADYWSKPLRKCWMSFGLFFIGKHNVHLTQLLNNLSSKRIKKTYPIFSIPNIYTVNLVGVPLGKKENKIFKEPNDGYSPLLDELIDSGLTITEVGADHTFENIDLNVRLAAILNYIDLRLNLIK